MLDVVQWCWFNDTVYIIFKIPLSIQHETSLLNSQIFLSIKEDVSLLQLSHDAEPTVLKIRYHLLIVHSIQDLVSI